MRYIPHFRKDRSGLTKMVGSFTLDESYILNTTNDWWHEVTGDHDFTGKVYSKKELKRIYKLNKL